jgi:hypothetical protein
VKPLRYYRPAAGREQASGRAPSVGGFLRNSPPLSEKSAYTPGGCGTVAILPFLAGLPIARDVSFSTANRFFPVETVGFVATSMSILAVCSDV